MRYERVLRRVPIAAPALLAALSLAAAAPAWGVTSQAAGVSSRASSAQSGQQPLTPALAKRLSRNVTDKVIIVLRNQFKRLPDTPANSAHRTGLVRAAQRGVLSELAATHARNVKSISLVNAAAATVSPGEAKRLAGNPAVAEVTPDLPIPVLPSMPTIKPHKPAAGVPPLPGACPPKASGVQLDPEALQNIHAAAQSGKTSAQGLGYAGTGVKVAWIADGIDINNPDFIRANGKHVFVDYRDFSGTGTSAPTNGGEAFLDASSIAAQGRHVYNIQTFGNPPGLNRPCRIRVLGVAPGASLVGLNVTGSSNAAFNSVFLEAIDWAVTHDHVNVLNESFGSNPFPDTTSLDLTKQADEAAVKAGVTVVAASGDAGVTNTLGSPATDPLFISAGATTTFRSYAQTDAFGIIGLPGVNGWLDNNISGLSSAGFSQAGGTVNVVAPGDLNWTLCTPKPTLFAACTDFSGNPASVQLSGGTSESAPLTAGTAALVIQAYRQGHGGRSPSPAVVKKIIVSTAQDISAPAEQQGAGIVDAYQAVLAARSYPGGRTVARKGHAVLDSATQLNAVGPAAHAEHLSDTITNDGSSKVTLKLSSRMLSAPVTRASTILNLTSGAGYFAEVQFHVPAGQARLNVSATLPAGGMLLALISPTGKLAGFNIPQGPGGFGNAQVANPGRGTWSAFIQGIPNNPSVPSIRTPFLATTSTFKSFGSLSKHSITLAPGASSTFKLNVSTPVKPGDQAGSVVLRSTASQPGFAAVTTIPVTLRSLVPAPTPTTSFSGTLTGGNGRAPSIGQTAYYQLRLPPGQAVLNASVATGNPNNTLFAVLVDPSGEAVSAAQNGLQTTSGGSLVLEKGAQLHVLKPAAGVWTLIVDFYTSVSGTAVNQPFTVKLNVTPVKTSQTGLPDSASTKLMSGVPVTASIKVTNSGAVPEAYFVDARLNTKVNLNLAAQTTSTLTLPNVTGVVPTYLVPSLTTGLSAQVSAPKPNIFDLNWAFGDPDLPSNTANTSKVKFLANDIPNGDWTVTPFLKGPDGAHGASNVTATTSLVASTNAIDPTVAASSGDLWDESTNPSASFTPVIVMPGQTVTIPVTITPSGSSGHLVAGTIYLSDVSVNPGALTVNLLPSSAPTASTVASFPYTYTIK